MSKVVKNVAFNDAKEEDVKILSFIGSRNFSGYVKSLILEDMAKQHRPMRIVQRSMNGGIKYVVGK
jgi:hypothetical protein